MFSGDPLGGPVISLPDGRLGSGLGQLDGIVFFDGEECKLLQSFLGPLAPISIKGEVFSSEAGPHWEPCRLPQPSPMDTATPTVRVAPSPARLLATASDNSTPKSTEPSQTHTGVKEVATACGSKGTGAEQSGESSKRGAAAFTLRRSAKTAEALKLMAEHTKDRRRESARRARARKSTYVKSMELDHAALRAENTRMRGILMSWAEQGFMDLSQARDFLPLPLQRDCLAFMAPSAAGQSLPAGGSHASAAAAPSQQPSLALPGLPPPSLDNLFPLHLL